MISETSLVQNSKATWLLLEMPQNILICCKWTAVAPINDTEITIMGGISESKLSDVVVFNTTTKQCQKATAGDDYKFYARGNQCVQACQNKVIALVRGEEDKLAVISWKKGADIVIIFKKF